MLGTDVAGTVVEVGPGVTRFNVGDRIVGLAVGTAKGRNRAEEGAFRSHVVLLEHMASPLPESVTFTCAATLPLAISTAASGLFQKDFLGMSLPKAGAVPKHETLLVWGASTSVGNNAVLLAKAAGYDVVATAGPANFAMVEALGADQVLDYADPATPRKIVQILAGRRVAGAIAIGAGSSKACIDVIARCEGNRFVAEATTPVSFEHVPAKRGHWRALVPAMLGMVGGKMRLALSARRKWVNTNFIWGTALIDNEVGPAIFENYLPSALREGYCAKLPAATISGSGLAAIPDALEQRRNGVQATKVVVTI